MFRFLYRLTQAPWIVCFSGFQTAARGTIDIELPTGNGDISLIHTAVQGALPTNPFGNGIYAFLLPEFDQPRLSLNTTNFPSRSYLTFAFVVEYAGGPIIGMAGITSQAGQDVQGIGFDDTYNLTFRAFLRRPG